MTQPDPLQQVGRTYVRWRGRKLSYFSGCDYFRLASHPKVLAAARSGLHRYGLNVAASRMTTGNHSLYENLESQLARFFKAPAALLVSSGYLTNLIVAQAFAGNFSHALLDERAHTSLQDAARFLDCPLLKFRHLDVPDLEAALRRIGPEARPIVLTDGMFAHNGAAAPLNKYLDVLPKDALLLVDDAHAAGVLGRNGCGSLEHTGINRTRVIQTITLSKAFGAFGGAILLPSTPLRQQLIDRSHAFVGSTPPPLPLANAASQALTLLTRDRGLRRRLLENIGYLRAGLIQAGKQVAAHPGPILAVLPTNQRAGSSLRKALQKASIFPPFIQYPGGPPNGFFRFVISSEHSRKQLDALLKVLKQAPDWQAG